MNIIGEKFGRLTVVEFDEKRKNNKYWICKCDCGTIKSVCVSNLKRGISKSCGCLHKEILSKRIKEHPIHKQYENEIGAKNHLLKSYKLSANKRNIKFELTDEQFFKLTKQNCYYCNSEPSNFTKIKGFNKVYIYNGIDRIDNNMGYIFKNCVSCCSNCNYMKHQLNKEEFIKHIRKIFEFTKDWGV